MLPYVVRNQRGSLMLSLVIAVMAAFAIMYIWNRFDQSSREVARYIARLDREKTQTLLTDMMSDPICSCQWNGIQVNTSTLAPVSLNELRSGCDLSMPENRVFVTGQKDVTGIQLTGLELTGNQTLKGYLVVNRRQDGPGDPPVSVLVNVRFNPAAPGATKPITRCSAARTGTFLSACPSGYALVGEPGMSSTFCVQTTTVQGTYPEGYTKCPQHGNSMYGMPRKCFNGDWYRACKAGAFSVGAWEWTLGNAVQESPDATVFTSGWGGAMGGGPEGCESIGVRPLDEINGVRCCIYNGL